MERTLFEQEHQQFRQAFRKFVEREIEPHHAQWEKDGQVPKQLWRKAGESGFLGMDVPEQYGGAGVNDFRYSAVMIEEIVKADASGVSFSLHNDIILPYFLEYATDEQRKRWLPGMVSGELITAIAMSEPGTGSDLQGVRTTAKRDGDHYIVNGQKTFISNGLINDLVVVVAKTDPDAGHEGISLIVVERGMKGYESGRKLEKIGQHAQDTAELFFQDVRVPKENLLGGEGQGFYHLMQQLPQERLTIAVGAVAACERILDMTLEYCKERTAFGRPIGKFQNTRFKLAEVKTETHIARVFVDHCINLLNKDELSVEEAAMAKWWTTELQKRAADECLQFFGGYGYMTEYPISKAYLDTRVQTIYGGTTEIMKEIIGRGMGL